LQRRPSLSVSAHWQVTPYLSTIPPIPSCSAGRFKYHDGGLGLHVVGVGVDVGVVVVVVVGDVVGGRGLYTGQLVR